MTAGPIALILAGILTAAVALAYLWHQGRKPE